MIKITTKNIKQRNVNKEVRIQEKENITKYYMLQNNPIDT